VLSALKYLARGQYGVSGMSRISKLRGRWRLPPFGMASFPGEGRCGMPGAAQSLSSTLRQMLQQRFASADLTSDHS
jgi:hypothetical protein